MAKSDRLVAIVTGGSRGIGLATARALAGRGIAVVLGARSPAGVEQAVADIETSTGATGHVLGVQCDVRRYEDCQRLVAAAVDRFGRLDILVNNAGVGVYARADQLSPEDWRNMIGTNLDGVFYCCREAIPHLERQGGWIINIGSLSGKHAFRNGTAYNASKFGLVGFSEALMEDVRHAGIRVSLIMPGSVATGFSGSEPGPGDAWKVQPEDVAQVVLDLLDFPARTMPSRVEMRPTRPPVK